MCKAKANKRPDCSEFDSLLPLSGNLTVSFFFIYPNVTHDPVLVMLLNMTSNRFSTVIIL